MSLGAVVPPPLFAAVALGSHPLLDLGNDNINETGIISDYIFLDVSRPTDLDTALPLLAGQDNIIVVVVTAEAYAQGDGSYAEITLDDSTHSAGVSCPLIIIR